MSLLEFGKSQIQLQAPKLGIELQSLPVRRDGFRIFLLSRQIKPETGKSYSIVGITLGELLPHLGGLTPLLLLLEREGVGRAGRLRDRERAAKDQGSELGEERAHAAAVSLCRHLRGDCRVRISSTGSG